ncbi:MAG TPA: hexose kinase [Streptosporangiaceae bacterium]|nr:hexose kinase [Streptosporangiaceae bacterium]
MIIVVCLNPALDVTHHVDAVDWGGVNRPRAVRARPGGKGLNVARTLHTLGVDVLVLGLAGGITGAGVEAALRERCVPAALTPVAGETRRTFSVVDDRTVTAFYEAGPTVGEEEFAGFRRGYEQALDRATAVVLSGSLPPGLEAGTYATLIETAAAAAVPAVLDTHGEALRRGAAAGPAIVKPNLTELAALAGPAASSALAPPADGPANLATVAAAAGQLRGAQAVVVTLGPDGLLAATGDGCWRARAPAAVAGNATGAGDAVAAALAHGLVLGRPWDERLRHAAALGAATAAAPVAGEFRRQDYLGALTAVTVEEVR